METKPSEFNAMWRILLILLLAVYLLPSVAIADPSTSYTGGQCTCRCPNGRTVTVPSCYKGNECYAACGIGNSSGSSSSGGGGLNTQQQMGLELGKIGIQMLFQGLQGGDPGNAQLEEQRQAEEKARAAEQMRITEQMRIAEEQERQAEAAKQRLLGGLKGLGASPKLSLKGINSRPDLQLKTGDQAEQAPTLDQYRAWEKYKRDVLAYQELVTKNNPKNKENQHWCESHIPLSTGPNRVNWEARCNPDGRVGQTDNVTASAPKVETAAAQAVAAKPALKDPADALAGSDEQVKTAAQGGFDSKEPMLGKPDDVPKIPETTPVGDTSVVATPALKDPAVALAGSDEQANTAAQGGFDTKDPMLGKLGVAPKVPETFPVGAALVSVAAPAVAATHAAATRPPVVSAATKVHIKVPVPPKETPSHVERQLVTGKQAESTPKPAPKRTSSPPSQKAVAEKQAQALSCATSELQELANGMGEEGARLRAELKTVLDDVRVELSKPCSGQPKTHNIQTVSLSGLTKGAKRKEDHLEENVLVTRDEETCEVRLNVQHASSLKSASSFRSPGQPFNEGQSVIRMDKAGNILAAETPAGVEKCLARLSAKEQ